MFMFNEYSACCYHYKNSRETHALWKLHAKTGKKERTGDKENTKDENGGRGSEQKIQRRTKRRQEREKEERGGPNLGVC
jgi:hypothetical protein